MRAIGEIKGIMADLPFIVPTNRASGPTIDNQQLTKEKLAENPPVTLIPKRSQAKSSAARVWERAAWGQSIGSGAGAASGAARTERVNDRQR